MNSDNFVIVKAHSSYNNTLNGIIINDSIETVGNINREVEVVTHPKFVNVRKGDNLIIHHNILRRKYDIKGNIINSNFWIENDLYYVPLSEIFMIKEGDIWKAFSPFVFVKPLRKEINITNFQLDQLHQHVGVIKYSNDFLIDKGFVEGNKIIFNKNSEYKFNIEGEELYKMTTSDVLLKLDEECKD